MRIVTLLMLAVAGFCTPASVAAQESPLLGKALPRLALSHPVQGDAWAQDDLLGSVVVLDLFQLG